MTSDPRLGEEELSLFAHAQALSDPDKLLAACFSSPTVGLAIVGSDFRYLAINSELARMNGIPAPEHLGKTLRDILRDVANLVEPKCRRAFETGEPVFSWAIQDLPAAQRQEPVTFDLATFGHFHIIGAPRSGRSQALRTIAAAAASAASVPDLHLYGLDCGNGALLAGVGRWMKAHSPATRVVAVCATGAPSMALSLQSGTVQCTATADTIADGIAVRVPVPEALDDLASVVDDRAKHNLHYECD